MSADPSVEQETVEQEVGGAKKRSAQDDDEGVQTKKQRVDEPPTGTAPTEEEVKLWLGGMSREEAIAFIAQLAIKHEGAMNDVQELVRLDPTFTKLFVRSLSWDTTDESLLRVFEEYGDIKECVVVKDHITHKSKGFGFVTFQNVESVQKALQESTKIIDGRETYCHLASEKYERAKQKSQGGYGTTYNVVPPQRIPLPSPPVADLTGINTAECKLFIHGLAWESTSQTLRRVFEQYGPVAECAVIYDKQSGKSKGYGFVTYYTPDGAQNALRESTKTIDGRSVYVHLASERSRGGLGGGGPGGGGPGGGGGGGGFPGQGGAKFITSSPLPSAIPGAIGHGGAPNSQVIQHQLLQLQQQQMHLQQQLPQYQYQNPPPHTGPHPGQQ